jgi:hypothetical protein
MHKLASGLALTLSLPLFPLGLVVLLLSEPGYRIWGVPMMLAGLGPAFGWWLLTGQSDGTRGRVPPGRHMLLTVGAILAVEFFLMGWAGSPRTGGRPRWWPCFGSRWRLLWASRTGAASSCTTRTRRTLDAAALYRWIVTVAET